MYAELERKTCRQCAKELSVKEFRFRKDRIGTRRTPNYESYCLRCEELNRKKRYAKTKPEQKLQDYRRNCARFGLSVEQYEIMVLAQDNKCAICNMPETSTRAGIVKRLAIDHCHETGIVRGLLCCDCNVSIGKMKENKDRLRAAIEYLGKFKN